MILRLLERREAVLKKYMTMGPRATSRSAPTKELRRVAGIEHPLSVPRYLRWNSAALISSGARRARLV